MAAEGEIVITVGFKRTIQHVQYEPQDVALSLSFPLRLLNEQSLTAAVKGAVTAYRQLEQAGNGLLSDALAKGRVRPSGPVAGQSASSLVRPVPPPRKPGA